MIPDLAGHGRFVAMVVVVVVSLLVVIVVAAAGGAPSFPSDATGVLFNTILDKLCVHFVMFLVNFALF